MEYIGLEETKTHLSDIISKVCDGREYTITRKGTPVARLIPAEKPNKEASKQALIRAKKLREKLTLGDLNLNDLIEEGRR